MLIIQAVMCNVKCLLKELGLTGRGKSTLERIGFRARVDVLYSCVLALERAFLRLSVPSFLFLTLKRCVLRSSRNVVYQLAAGLWLTLYGTSFSGTGFGVAAEGALSFSVASVVEDVLQQHGIRSRELGLDSRRAEEAVFPVVAQELGLPTFDASDMEQGGKSARVVICVLALKSYSDWKQTGADGVWKFGGNLKAMTSGKHFMRKNSEPFTGSLTRNLSMGEKSLNAITADLNSNNKCSSSLSMLVRAILLDKKPEEVPTVEEKSFMRVKREECFHRNHVPDGESEKQFLKQKMIFEQQNRDIVFHEDIQNVGLHIHGLTYAASGYHKVLEENCKLYNQVQDLKGSIRVYCRVRPFLGGQSKYLSSVEHIEKGTITITTPSKYRKGHRSFNFNKVFRPSATQAKVFSDTQPLIRSVLDGVGPRITKQNQGVNYRALGDLFLLAKQRKNTVSFDVFVKMLEIYNEQVRDLLITDGLNKRYPLILEKNRAVGATALSDHSSRFHSSMLVGETISTLKFAERVAIVELGAACVNKNSADVEELKEQIASLKAALARKEGQVEPM
ncbi:hypothetical protein HYC85_031898 [Camellia sinensis]|uniref:Kinesin motor domain-containing protein n=1 Tax=Camellia sinensis TaxID=4442 RepID=A0A7J7FRV6_CAMSI|nr:hypothetical protein HYC85_031898 [Camellia sinensis]